MRSLIDYLFHFNPNTELAIEEGLARYNASRERKANVVWLCRKDWEEVTAKRSAGEKNGRVPGVRWGLNACSKESGNVMVGRVE